MTTSKFKIPKTLPACADRRLQLDDLISKLTAQVKQLDEERKALNQHLIDNLPKSKATGTAGKLARAQIVKDPKPVIRDAKKFFAYLGKTKAFDLIQRRLNEKAVKDRWEAGKVVPGIDKFNVVKVKITRLKGKEKTK